MEWNGMEWNGIEWTGSSVAQYSTPYHTSHTSKHTSNWYHHNEGKSLRSSFLSCRHQQRRRQRPPMISDC